VCYLQYVVIWQAQWKLNTAMYENGSENEVTWPTVYILLVVL